MHVILIMDLLFIGPTLSGHTAQRPNISGKGATVVKSRTKSQSSGSSERQEQSKLEQRDAHPEKRAFTPVVTCRYPEMDWRDAEAFPTLLPMVRNTKDVLYSE